MMLWIIARNQTEREHFEYLERLFWGGRREFFSAYLAARFNLEPIEAEAVCRRWASERRKQKELEESIDRAMKIAVAAPNRAQSVSSESK